MKTEKKIARILSVVTMWGGFSPKEVSDGREVIINSLVGLRSVITYVSLDCVDVSLYDLDSDFSMKDFTMMYSELSDDVLDSLLLLCRDYNELMLEQDEE
jgi:hypothetical protein